MNRENSFTLHNGVLIPKIGYGTWQIPNEEAYDAVTAALEIGYRHIDTAFNYNNEENVGRAIRESGIPREEIFVTSKLRASAKGYDITRDYFEQTMANLGLDYLDLYLIHWPWPFSDKFGDYDKENIECWTAMEEFYKAGRVRAIGVSNFSIADLQNLIDHCEIVPMVNQIPFYVGRDQEELLAFCKEHNILVEAYSPLATGEILNSPEIQRMAEKYGATPAQICIKYCLQRDTLPLPKSSHPERMRQNLELDFHISEDDMRILSEMEDVRQS